MLFDALRAHVVEKPLMIVTNVDNPSSIRSLLAITNDKYLNLAVIAVSFIYLSALVLEPIEIASDVGFRANPHNNTKLGLSCEGFDILFLSYLRMCVTFWLCFLSSTVRIEF